MLMVNETEKLLSPSDAEAFFPERIADFFDREEIAFFGTLTERAHVSMPGMIWKEYDIWLLGDSLSTPLFHESQNRWIRSEGRIFDELKQQHPDLESKAPLLALDIRNHWQPVDAPFRVAELLRYADHTKYRNRGVAAAVVASVTQRMQQEGTEYVYVNSDWTRWPKELRVIPAPYGRMYTDIEQIRKPHAVRATLKFKDKTVYIYAAPVLELYNPKEPIPKMLHLGPDILSKKFNAKEVVKNMRKYPDEEIGPVLINQEVMAGPGNIFKSEGPFETKIHPSSKVKNLTDEQLTSLIEAIKRQMEFAIDNKTTWNVFRKGKRSCPRCKATIRQFRQAGRWTYACDGCQVVY